MQSVDWGLVVKIQVVVLKEAKFDFEMTVETIGTYVFLFPMQLTQRNRLVLNALQKTENC